MEIIFHDLYNQNMVLFYSYVCQRVLSQVVLDTYEAYDIAEKKWLPPQRLGANGKFEGTTKICWARYDFDIMRSPIFIY